MKRERKKKKGIRKKEKKEKRGKERRKSIWRDYCPSLTVRSLNSPNSYTAGDPP